MKREKRVQEKNNLDNLKLDLNNSKGHALT